MLNILLSLLGKLLIKISRILNLGSGSTWPGHIALKINKHFLSQTVGDKTKIVLVAGTNGKTTTSSLIAHILDLNGKKVLLNKSGANLLNGASSTIIEGLSLFRPKLEFDYLILEVDENSLPLVLESLTPNYIICLNLFRDQLDRYGEIHSIISKWKKSFEKLGSNTTLILNADDPQVSYLGSDTKAKALYFGLTENNQTKLEHGADSTYCPRCLHSLNYKSIIFSHLGNWTCSNCKLKRNVPNINNFDPYPLPGTYNKYNTLAAVLFSRQQNLSDENIENALKTFKPAFGRQEEFEVNGKKIKIFLSKNPTSFNQSLSTVNILDGKYILLALNDRIPDGLDVSWIWDINFENLLSKKCKIFVSGERTFDLALRLKYAGTEDLDVYPSLDKAVSKAVSITPHTETLFILATYSAMLGVRKILKGRKIL